TASRIKLCPAGKEGHHQCAGQFRGDQVLHEAQLGMPFAEEEDSDQVPGPPPTRFFCQISPAVNSSSHAASSSSRRRCSVVSLPMRLATAISPIWNSSSIAGD